MPRGAVATPQALVVTTGPRPWEANRAGAGSAVKILVQQEGLHRMDGAALRAGTSISGPAVIEHPGTTIVLHTGHSARIDEFGNTRIASSH